MNIEKYPAEIVAWLQTLPAIDQCTAQQRRIRKILDDEEVSRCAAKLFEKANNNDDQDTARQEIDDFRALIEDVVAIPDENPPGTVLRTGDSDLVFLTPTEIRRTLTNTAAQALKLVELIAQAAPTLAGDNQHLEYLKQMIEQLDQAIIIEKSGRCGAKESRGFAFGQ